MTENTRSFFWWATAIVAPLGILGGPIAIASMLDGLITWNGPVDYILNIWDAQIREPFRNVIEWIRLKLSFPQPDPLLIDYIILSILLTSSYVRATYLVPKNGIWHTVTNSLRYLLIWPLATIAVVISVAREGVKSWPRLLLTFAPFIGFLGLWAVNMISSMA